jgi:chaperone protein EcpD
MSALAGLFVFSMDGYASVQVMGTRFVYPEGGREVIVELNNESVKPSLVQTWIDAGDATAMPGADKVPFTVIPPLTRIEANKGQSLRILHTEGALPKDRESVFWLNVLDIPPKADDVKDKNVMQLAFRTRLKLFYRPANLEGSPKEAAEKLQWSVVKIDKGYAARARNTSGYHVSLSRVELKSAGKVYEDATGGMVAPGATHDFPLKGLSAAPGKAEIKGEWLDDFGAARTQQYPL